jgi:hypothetical protein
MITVAIVFVAMMVLARVLESRVGLLLARFLIYTVYLVIVLFIGGIVLAGLIDVLTKK